jgi:hypothetical protein
MIRKLVVLFLSVVGGGILVAGCAGQCMDRGLTWAYTPQRWPLTIPSVSFSVCFFAVAAEWVSLESQSSDSNVDTPLYTWGDHSRTSVTGVRFRHRYLFIKAPLVPCVAALLLTYPVGAFLKGPYRRYGWRRKGCCPRCGYTLAGNVSGVCPECGSAFDAERMRTRSAAIAERERRASVFLRGLPFVTIGWFAVVLGTCVVWAGALLVDLVALGVFCAAIFRTRLSWPVLIVAIVGLVFSLFSAFSPRNLHAFMRLWGG